MFPDDEAQYWHCLEAAMVRCSSSMECSEVFPAAVPDRSGCSPTVQVPDAALVFDLKIPPPDLRPEIPPLCSSLSEDVEALTPIRPETTEPCPTMCTIVKSTRCRLPDHKVGHSEGANKMSPDQTQSCL
ncbi:hypothetical protein MRX96_039267 [Rhipicephalus microplus]